MLPLEWAIEKVKKKKRADMLCVTLAGKTYKYIILLYSLNTQTIPMPLRSCVRHWLPKKFWRHISQTDNVIFLDTPMFKIQILQTIKYHPIHTWTLRDMQKTQRAILKPICDIYQALWGQEKVLNWELSSLLESKFSVLCSLLFVPKVVAYAFHKPVFICAISAPFNSSYQILGYQTSW